MRLLEVLPSVSTAPHWSCARQSIVLLVQSNGSDNITAFDTVAGLVESPDILMPRVKLAQCQGSCDLAWDLLHALSFDYGQSTLRPWNTGALILSFFGTQRFIRVELDTAVHSSR